MSFKWVFKLKFNHPSENPRTVEQLSHESYFQFSLVAPKFSLGYHTLTKWPCWLLSADITLDDSVSRKLFSGRTQVHLDPAWSTLLSFAAKISRGSNVSLHVLLSFKRQWGERKFFEVSKNSVWCLVALVHSYYNSICVTTWPTSADSSLETSSPSFLGFCDVWCLWCLCTTVQLSRRWVLSTTAVAAGTRLCLLPLLLLPLHRHPHSAAAAAPERYNFENMLTVGKSENFVETVSQWKLPRHIVHVQTI